ncbi:MAG: hypothetical protein ACM3UV_05715, partial [Nocardioidaceae bacterium]
ARAPRPAEVPRADAAHNVARATRLVLGRARDDPSLVARGLGDRLHQPRRRHLYPRSMELLERAEELGALGATISGAGPTVLLWSPRHTTDRLLGALRERAPDCSLRRVEFVADGAEVRLP